MNLHVIEPLQDAVTDNGTVRRGTISIGERTFWVECAADASWAFVVHGEEHDLLTRDEAGRLLSPEPSLTGDWSLESLAAFQRYVEQKMPNPAATPEFIKRPQQGFIIPQNTEPSEPVYTAPTPDLKKRNEMLAISFGYLLLGYLMAQSESNLIWTLGGFVLLIGIKGLYENWSHLISLVRKAFNQRQR